VSRSSPPGTPASVKVRVAEAIFNHRPRPVLQVKTKFLRLRQPAGAVIRDSDVVLADWRGEVPTGASFHTEDFVGRGVITGS
jgi:hypothetical protein